MAADDPPAQVGGGARGVALFAVRVLALAVPLFALWYLVSAPLSLATGWTAARLVQAAAPVDRVGVAYGGHALAFTARPDYETLERHHMRTDIVLEVPANAMQFTFGMPFFLALVLATSMRPRWPRVALDIAALLLLAAVGLYFSVHLQLAQVAAPDGGLLFSTGEVAREALALGFQVGTLLIPVLAPVVLWAAGEGRGRISL